MSAMPLFLRNPLLVFLLFLAAVLLTSCAHTECYAQDEGGNGAPQEAAPPEIKKEKDHLQETSNKLLNNGGWWGPGRYLSAVKLPLYIALFLLWVATAGWVNADQERLHKEKRESFNLLYLLLYGIVGGLVFIIPLFWVAFPLTLLICVAPPLIYVAARNQSLPPGDQVLTREHLWFVLATTMTQCGIKMKYEKRRVYETGPLVDLEPVAPGVEPQALQARLILARNAPGYNLLRENINDAVRSRATALRFEFAQDQTKIWHQVDGTWLELVPIPRKLGQSKEKDIYDEMQEAVKKLIGGNHEDRRSKQIGKFKATVGNPKKKSKLKKLDVDYMTQGTPTGEAAMLLFHSKTVAFKTLDEIGMRTEMQPKVLEQINGNKGIVLISAPPTHGLRSTMTVLSRVCDRFTKDVANVEDVHGAGEPIENVIPGMYDSSKGETPVKPLSDLLFRGIVCIFVRDMSLPETLKTSCEALMHDNHLFITMVRAKDGVETLLRFLSAPFPAKQVVPYLNAVVCQRLIRKLCPECREAYEPSPQELQSLRLKPNQVQQLFRKRTPLPNPQEEARRGVCPQCHGVGYFGRTALFELLTVSDTTKTLLVTKVDPAAIRQQFNKEGQQTFVHEGIRLILQGETSVEELSRVLKM